MRRRAAPGDALADKAGGGPTASGPRRGVRRPGRDRRDRPARRAHVPGARRQAPGEAAPEQPAAGDEHQERPAEPGLQQVGSSRFASEGIETSARVLGVPPPPRDGPRAGSRASVPSREDLYDNLTYFIGDGHVLYISIRISTFESREPLRE